MTAARVLELDGGMAANPEAERSILGAVLLDNDALSEAAPLLCPDDFSLDSNRRIYRRMLDMLAANIPIEPTTLLSELSRHKELETVGGAAYLSSLTDGLPRRSSIEFHSGIVKEKAQLRCLINAADRAIARALDGDTPTEVASGMLESILDVEARGQNNRALTPREFMPEVIHEMELQARSEGLIGLPTGLKPLDDSLSGLHLGELVVVGALPGSCKTAFAGQILTANADLGNHCAVFSLEMSRWDLGRRFLAGVTSVPAVRIRRPNHLKRDEWAKLATGATEIGSWPLWVDDSGSLSVTELIARARVFTSRMKVRLIVVDYLQLVRAEARDVRERVSKVADALRQLAKSERVAIVLLSQLRRPEKMSDEPTMIQLKESGDIEAHAHVVLLLHTPIAKDGEFTGEEKIIVAKNRNGQKGSVTVFFDTKKLRFYPRETSMKPVVDCSN